MEFKKKNLIRFNKILEIIKTFKERKKIKVLDFGCGLSDLYIFLKKKKINNIYYGIDTSKKAILFSKKKFKKNNYYFADIFKDKKIVQKLPNFDVIVLNGIFTIKDKLSYFQMLEYFKFILLKLKTKMSGILIFNLISQNVEWKNDQNFYPNDLDIVKIINNILKVDYVKYSQKDIHEDFYVVLNKK